LAIKISIISVTTEQATAKNGKAYNKLNVAYKNLTFKGKVEGKQLFPFGNKEVYTTLQNASPGDVFNIEVQKNAQGYNDWIAATPSTGEDVANAVIDGGGATSFPAGRGQTGGNVNYQKRDYETAEERAKKQIYIIRQSSISSAIDLLSTGAKSPPKVEEVLEVAKRFEDFVFGTEIPAEGAPGLVEMDDDIPY